MKKLTDLEKNLGIKFKKINLLKEALTHRSYLNETVEKNLLSNERLEFLGDSVLSFVISQWLYELLGNKSEGVLTEFRSNLVKTESLAKMAKKFLIGNYLFLSRGEEQTGGRNNPLLLANTFEAIIGAILLDQGLAAVKNFLKSNFKTDLEKLLKSGETKDHKSVLQEKIQAQGESPPVYRVIREKGPDHAKTFTVGVLIKNKLISIGQGKNKQSAEQQAAKSALEKLNLRR